MEDNKDHLNSRNWDRNDKVKVRILSTGVETVVPRGYQLRYANEGVIYLEDYKEEKVVAPRKPPKEDKEG